MAALYTRGFLLANAVNLVGLSASNCFVLLPLYLTQRHVEAWAVGVLMGGYSLAAVLARPLLGHQMDVRGRRPFILGGLVAMAACSLGYLACGDDMVLLGLVRFAQGAATAIFFTSLFTWVADHAPPGRMAEALGMYGMSGLLSMAVGPGLGEWLLARTGFAGLFAWAAAGMLAAAVIALSLTDREAVHAVDAGEVPDAGSFLALALRPSVWSTTVTAFLFGSANQAVAAFIAPYLEDLDRVGEVPDVSGFFSAYVAAALAVRLVAGVAADRVGRVALAVPAIVFLAAGLAVLGRASGVPFILTAGFLMGIGHGTIYPTLNALLMDRSSPRDRGKAMALFTGCLDLGGFVGGATYGAVATALGYSLMYEAAGAVMLAALLLFLGLERGWGKPPGNS